MSPASGIASGFRQLSGNAQCKVTALSLRKLGGANNQAIDAQARHPVFST